MHGLGQCCSVIRHCIDGFGEAARSLEPPTCSKASTIKIEIDCGCGVVLWCVESVVAVKETTTEELEGSAGREGCRLHNAFILRSMMTVIARVWQNLGLFRLKNLASSALRVTLHPPTALRAPGAPGAFLPPFWRW